ncbi:unnamed protein product [Rodentolepis nana]|uniref:Catalase n=1 Tax=Rodentolepis nana TaxID=102285 RepID=A0A0R3T9V8_RODNA|nr:unnamed protein product [Rodentolepis nana]
MSDNLASDDSLLADESSASNRTIGLEEATFPLHTPIIDADGNCHHFIKQQSLPDFNRGEVPSYFDEVRGTQSAQWGDT